MGILAVWHTFRGLELLDGFLYGSLGRSRWLRSWYVCIVTLFQNNPNTLQSFDAATVMCVIIITTDGILSVPLQCAGIGELEGLGVSVGAVGTGGGVSGATHPSESIHQ